MFYCVGEVYHATWKSRYTEVAVKELRITHMDEESLKKFGKELYNMKCIPPFAHVLQLLGVCIDEKRKKYLMVMEWMDQKSLSHYLDTNDVNNSAEVENREESKADTVTHNNNQEKKKSNKLTLLDRLRICLQCAKAVNHLHYLPNQVLHRDIKTSNFLINSKGEVKIGQHILTHTIYNTIKYNQARTYPYAPIYSFCLSCLSIISFYCYYYLFS